VEYTIFETQFGWVGILASEKGIKTITLPQPTALQAQKLLGEGTNQTQQPSKRLSDLTERLKAYFNGERVEFHERLDLTEATPFQKQVWEQTMLISYGQTKSYQWVAGQIGKPGAPRAVGQALGCNPIPIIVPCHRVLATSGGLCGFAGGLDMKEKLLKLEGVSVTRHLSLKKSRFTPFIRDSV
jgi:O-6-methylguanine DNA methyltransferase